MPPLAVLLKPRPTDELRGTNWLPKGLDYGPFDPAHSPPVEATELHDINVSQILIDQWAEFHTAIRPLLMRPPPLDSAPPRTLYTAWHAYTAPRVQRIQKFFHTIIHRTVELHTALGLHSDAGTTSIPSLCAELCDTELWPLTDRTFEFKITVNILHETLDYICAVMSYKCTVESRCSVWERLYAKGSSCASNFASSPVQSLTVFTLYSGGGLKTSICRLCRVLHRPRRRGVMKRMMSLSVPSQLLSVLNRVSFVVSLTEGPPIKFFFGERQ
ncbi:hypothetical protein B0H11DRAFT_2140040 [Mycena galericulata]|nr:hypothetical protein B0H11DRAFT_2140040 [Mycena galericulata]